MNNKEGRDHKHVKMAKSKEKKAESGKKSSEVKKTPGEKSKSRRTSESKEAKELTWQEKLLQAQMNDENFTCSVTMFVQAEPKYQEYLQHFVELCDPGWRRCIDVVSRNQIKSFFETKDRKMKKERDEVSLKDKDVSKKDKDTPKSKKSIAVSKQEIKLGKEGKVPKELFELAEPMFREANVTTEIMAYLVKCYLIAVKEETIERAALEKKLAEEMEKEYKIVRGDGQTGKKEGKKDKEKKKERPEKKKKKGEKTNGDKKTPTIETADKKLTKLRKRGEEWRDVQYIEDFPPDGPNLYVALVGFHDPALPAELRKIGVPLHGLIKVASEQTPKQDPFPLTRTTTDEPPEIHEIGSQEMDFVLMSSAFMSDESFSSPHLMADDEAILLESMFTTTRLTTSSFGLTKKYSDIEQLNYFWSQVEKTEMQKILKDIASLTLVPQNFPPSDETKDFQTWKDNIYNEISYAMYDIEDICRQRNNYLENMYINNLGPFPPLQESGMELYDTMVRLIPSECMSIHYILHCMLEQVIMYEAPKNPPPTPKQSAYNMVVIQSEEHKNTNPEAYLEDQLEQLEIHYGLTKCEVFDYQMTDPKVLLYGDTLHKLTREINIPEINIPQITLDILRWSPIVKLWELYPQLTESEQLMYSYHLNKLLHRMEQDFITDRLLRIYLMITVLELMPCIYDKRRALQSPAGEEEKQIPAEELAPHDIRNLSDLLECPELIKLLLKNQDDGEPKYPRDFAYNMFRYVHMENLKPQVMLQVLQESMSLYNCVDYEYFKPTDTIILRFHNAEIKSKWEERWCESLRTPVGLRDFNNYVLEEEEKWFLEQEELYQKEIDERIERKRAEMEIQVSNIAALVLSPHSDGRQLSISQASRGSCTSDQFTIEGSLKHEIKKSEEKKPDGSGSKTFKESSLPQEESEIKKKTSFPNSASDKELSKISSEDLQLRPSNLISALHSAKTGSYVFEGYDLGAHKVKILGLTTIFYSPDGTNVKIERSKWVYGNTLNHSQFNKLGHSLSIYNYAGPPSTVNDPMIFHLTTRNGIILAFSRRNPFRPNIPDDDTEKDLAEAESKLRAVYEGSKTKELKKGKRTEKKTSDGKKKSTKEFKKKEDKELSQNVDEEKPSTEDISTEVSPETEVYFQYDMRLSCPSSLTVETVVGKEESNPFYIRQKYLTKGPTCDQIRDESHRYYLRNGNVVIFRTDGTVKILTPDSTIFFCNEFKKPTPAASKSSTPAPSESTAEVEDRKSKKKKTKTAAEQPKKKKGQKVKQEKLDEVTDDAREETEEKEDHLSSQKQPLWDITDYEILTAHGVKYRILNGVKQKIDFPLSLRTATDFELDEVFTRREDGTNTLLKHDGYLNVVYPDGTRITSYPVEMDDFQWSSEELKEIQETVVREYSEELKDLIEPLKKETATPAELTLSQLVDTLLQYDLDRAQSSEYYKNTLLRSDTLEPFVFIGLSCTIEHPNYATVTYNAINLEASIECPGDTKVDIDRTGIYKVHPDINSHLEVNPMSIIFEASACTECRSTSRTYVGLKGFLPLEEPEDVMSSTTDYFGNTFNVNYLGVATHYVPKQEEDTITHACVYNTPPVRGRYLVLHRDLFGIEFIHMEDLQSYVQLVERTARGCTNVDKMPGRAHDLNCYTTFLPIHETESSKWITPVNTESHLPTNLRRKDLQRSTYGNPPSWLFPFPKQRKNKKIKLKTASKLSIPLSSLQKSPKFLILRIIQDIEVPDHNVLDDVQAGLSKYWKDVKLIYKKYDSYKFKDSRTQEEREIDEKLFALVVSQMPKDVLEAYRIGLKPMTTPSSEEIAPVSPYHIEHVRKFYNNLDQEKQHAEFYKDLLRTKTIPGYFNTIEGEAFTTVLHTVESVPSISSFDCTKHHVHTDACRNTAIKEKFIPAFIHDMIPSIKDKFQSKRVQVDTNPSVVSHTSQTTS